MNGIALWPVAASQHAHRVDLLIASFGAMVWLVTLPVFVAMTWFIVRYRRGRQVNRTHPPDCNLAIELGWSVIPLLLALGFYVWATLLYFDLTRPPAGAIEIHLVARQWMWKYQHPAGAREINDLHVPVNTPVRLSMSSEDVIHSFYVPALRLKQDVLPGRTTGLWFRADRTGRFPLRCAQFCGMDHSVMGGALIVLPQQDYAAWLAAAPDGGSRADLAQTGAALARTLGCHGCHDPGAAVRAPPLAGLYGRPVTLTDGSVRTADEAFLRDAIVHPGRAPVAGYRPIMPDYGPLLSATKLDALLAWLETEPPR